MATIATLHRPDERRTYRVIINGRERRPQRLTLAQADALMRVLQSTAKVVSVTLIPASEVR